MPRRSSRSNETSKQKNSHWSIGKRKNNRWSKRRSRQKLSEDFAANSKEATVSQSCKELWNYYTTCHIVPSFNQREDGIQDLSVDAFVKYREPRDVLTPTAEDLWKLCKRLTSALKDTLGESGEQWDTWETEPSVSRQDRFRVLLGKAMQSGRKDRSDDQNDDRQISMIIVGGDERPFKITDGNFTFPSDMTFKIWPSEPVEARAEKSDVAESTVSSERSEEAGRKEGSSDGSYASNAHGEKEKEESATTCECAADPDAPGEEDWWVEDLLAPSMYE